MLKLVGTENGEVVDEKVILDDDNKPTTFFLKLLVIDILLDICLFNLFRGIVKMCKK